MTLSFPNIATLKADLLLILIFDSVAHFNTYSMLYDAKEISLCFGKLKTIYFTRFHLFNIFYNFTAHKYFKNLIFIACFDSQTEKHN